jgi:hypothetical protein
MTYGKVDPLCALTDEERQVLTQVSRSASHVARAKALLTVADGLNYQEAAHWQASQTWCETDKVKRKRKAGVVEVTNLDAEPIKASRAGLPDR